MINSQLIYHSIKNLKMKKTRVHDEIMTTNNRTCSIKDIVHRNHCMGMTIVVLNGKIYVPIKVTTLL